MFAWINTTITKTINSERTLHSPQSPIQLNPELLPDNLAGRILDLQFQSETEAINRDMVAQLTCLYIEAVQYHQARNSDKFKVYLQRKQHFLKKTAVQDVLKGKSGQLVNKKENTEKSINQARNKSRSEVTRIMNQTDKKAKQQETIINGNIDAQRKKLEERIHRRKVMSNRSTCSDRDQFQNEELGVGKNMVHGQILLGREGIMLPLNSGRQRQGKRVFI